MNDSILLIVYKIEYPGSYLVSSENINIINFVSIYAIFEKILSSYHVF